MFWYNEPDRPCVKCGKLTSGRDFITLNNRKKPQRVAVCPDVCRTVTSEKDKKLARDLARMERRHACRSNS